MLYKRKFRKKENSRDDGRGRRLEHLLGMKSSLSHLELGPLHAIALDQLPGKVKCIEKAQLRAGEIA